MPDERYFQPSSQTMKTTLPSSISFAIRTATRAIAPDETPAKMPSSSSSLRVQTIASAFVAGLGTGGTLMGNGRRFKEELGDAVKIVAAEPMQGEPVQGLRSLDDGFIPPIIDLSLLDRKIFVTNRDAVIWTKKLLDEEGIFAGVSSGAIASIAVRIAGELDEGNVVFIVCDDGWKYLSSGIYTKPIEELEDIDSTVWW